MIAEPLALPVRRRVLPAPSRERWEPLRAGIINLWQYAEQELWFHRGRLMLQGRNGAGKTKVLEVLFPFLFDANLDPHRLSASGGEGRDMRWNLLEGRKDGSFEFQARDSIVWLEFGRKAPTGETAFCTIGARMRASTGSPRVNVAYFLTDQRVGEDLELVGEIADPGSSRRVRRPVSRDRLEEAIGAHGGVWDQRGPYRAALDARLFALRGRLDGLVNLQRSLRRPKLSEKFDLETVVGHLRDALPPPDADLVAQQAEAFEGLHQEEQALEATRRAAAAVDAFLALYRNYATTEGRHVGAAVQAADAGARATATRVRRAKRHTEDLSKEIERLDGLMGQLREEIVAVGGKLAAHRASPEMRTAERLAEADRVATIAEGEATRLAEAAGDFEAEASSAADRAKTAKAIAAEHAANLTTEYRNAATKATIAALGVVHEALLTLIETDPTRARTEAERAIEGRQKLLTGLTEKLADFDTLHGQVATATELRDGAKRRLGGAIGARNRAIDALADARAKLGKALAAWVADLIELPVDETDIEPTLSDLDAGQELNALLLARAADPGNQLAQSRGGAIAARDATKFEIERLAAERERVAVLEIQRPEPVAVRPADRAGRAGAPFYECVDFAADLAEDRRAGIEAALEGAGVLDAWVTPEGRILDRDVLDAAVVAGTTPSGRTLRDVLVPAGDAVPAATVERILRSIGLGERGAGVTWAGPDGRFGLGLLAGQYTKPEAGFVGAGAREVTRRRRLAEIDAAIAEQRTILQTREHEITALDSRLTRLREEIADAPSDADLGTARTTLTERRGDETRAIEEYKRLDEAAAALMASEREREDALREELAAAGLPFEKVALARAQAAIGNYQVAIVELVTAVRDAKRTADESERLGDEALRVHAKADTARELATKAAGSARGLRATATELLALHGADAKTALQRLVELETEEKRLNDALDTARSNRITTGDDAATAKAELTIAREKLDEATEHWRSTTTTFRRFAASGLLELVRGPIEGDPTMWDDQHTASIAATIDASDTASFAEPARNALAGAVNRRYNELGSELGADFALDITQSPEDGLLLVEAQHGDDRTSIAGLGVLLDAEVDERAALLDRRTRELLSRYLLDGVGEELGERIREARTLIDRMNGELARCPTASGRTLRLRWELADEAPEGARRASELFLLPPANLNDADRGSLIEFLRDRVATARADEASPGFAAALATALDYRTWFVFRIDESTPTGWHRLTTRSHAAGSGGEQAVALHLPLFAAVAAYYSTAAHHAPRLFFLDEAFAGIDRPMRGLLMRFLVHFDLDFVFTSPDDWGTYAELDGAGIYHLYRDRDGGVRGVLARRFVWDGARLLDEAALRALDEQAG